MSCNRLPLNIEPVSNLIITKRSCVGDHLWNTHINDIRSFVRKKTFVNGSYNGTKFIKIYVTAAQE